jgi:riboflavin kinase/FMN adenylyltransferase
VEVFTDLADVPRPPRGSAVTIGAYDGVHLGHRAVLERLAALARKGGQVPAVVTFDRHPATVVRPASAPRLLTDLGQKLELLAATGAVEMVLVVTFDHARAAQEPEEFVAEVLVGALAARLVVVGEDFHFGHRRRGNTALLRGVGATAGFSVAALDLVEVPGADGPVSSTAIRRLVAAGDVAAAARLLGRAHEVRGVVAGGEGRGRGLGFPTANVNVPDAILLPGEGIYAGWYRQPDASVHPAAISIGRRPTFPGARPDAVLEAHLLDFDGDLYGQAAAVRFVDRLRDEERFESVEALVEQMALDVEAARALLGTPSPAASADAR